MNGVIEVRAELVPNGVDLTVSDNGMGIPEDKLAEVMEPFGQAHSTFARAQGGIGLGLPIVKSLVELHGGRFSISSTLNQGTAMVVHLPSERIFVWKVGRSRSRWSPSRAIVNEIYPEFIEPLVCRIGFIPA